MELHEPSPIKLPKLQAGTPEISMAPLIDVVFLLLIFFMVTTIFPDNHGLIIERPAAASAESLPDEMLSFTVDENGLFFHEEERITADRVRRLVKQRLAEKPGSAVVLEVDRRAATEALVRIMDACKQGGAQQIGIVTDAVSPPEPSGSG